MPFIVRWKGATAGREESTTRRSSSSTCCRPRSPPPASSVKAEWKLDGVNLLPYLTGENAGRSARGAVLAVRRQMAIRKGDWKLVKTIEGPLPMRTPAIRICPARSSSISRRHRRREQSAAARPEKVKELAGDWLRWSKEMAKPLWGPGGGARGRAGFAKPSTDQRGGRRQ